MGLDFQKPGLEIVVEAVERNGLEKLVLGEIRI